MSREVTIEELTQTPPPAKPLTLIIVEDASTAAMMQRGVDINVVRFGFPFMGLHGLRYDRVYVRWPSENWFTRRKVTFERFQDWVRMELTHHQRRKGPEAPDFQYF
jgi:hypothetical protein